jgi:hypothetical protein
MNKSIEDLEMITKNKSIDRTECQIPQNLMPLSLNVDKVFDIISRFNMLPVKSSEQGPK